MINLIPFFASDMNYLAGHGPAVSKIFTRIAKMFLLEIMMTYRFKLSVFTLSVLALMSMEASAQYYTLQTDVRQYRPMAVGVGINPGFHARGVYPNVGFGIGSVGGAVSTGLGYNGIGTGANIGVGPLGVTTDAGLSRNGLGTRGSLGLGNTGVGFEGGLSGDGLGVGLGAQIFGIGPSVSTGVGHKGPGLGASLAFGSLGTLLIGRHRHSYPGAQLTSAYANPDQTHSFYRPQNYGASPYYRPVPVQRQPYQYAKPFKSSLLSRCNAPWVC